MDTYWNESNWLEFLKMFDISHWYVQFEHNVRTNVKICNICDNVMKYKQTCIHIFTKIGTNMHTISL